MKRFLLCIGLLMAGVPLFAQDSAPATDATKFELVERNRRMPFIAGNGYVKQDNKVIATYTVEPIGEGSDARKYSFILPNGTVAAEGVMKGNNAGKIPLKTMIDGKMHTVGLKNISEMDLAREVAMFLSDNKYL